MPEAILLQDVETLGPRGTVIDVSKGYLRNYLIPRKLAQPATRGAIQAIRRRQEAAERAQRNGIERAEENVKLLNRTALTIPQPAGADVHDGCARTHVLQAWPSNMRRPEIVRICECTPRAGRGGHLHSPPP